MTFTLAGVSQDQHKVKPVGFIFSHTFQLIRMNFDLVLKKFKLLQILLVRFSETKEMTTVSLYEEKLTFA